MRKLSFLLVSGAFLVMSASWVDGQPGGDKKKGGFGGGGFGGGQGNSPLTLLNRADVKKELEVSDEQMEKLPAEVMIAISKVLNPKQFTRFKQLDLQKQGNNAFKDAVVQKQLNVNEDQKKSIATILDDSQKEVAELFKGGAGGGGKGGFGKGNTEKLDGIRKEAKEKIYNVLTKEQRKGWREMLGEEFKFEQTGFGGFGGGGKKTAPKDK
jgi:Spy/CpxP family protein refolding chaperone